MIIAGCEEDRDAAHFNAKATRDNVKDAKRPVNVDGVPWVPSLTDR